MKTLGFVGGGNMGTAIIAGGAGKYRFFVCEKDPVKKKFLKKKYAVIPSELPELVQNSQVIILAVKPQDMDGILSELKNILTPDKLVISIAAGLTTSFFEKALGPKIRVIRTMPNMPGQIGLGVTALCKGRWATPADLKTAEGIFANIGETVIVNEKMMDPVTAVSGSGPAYVFLFVECFLKAAQNAGFDAKSAAKLVGSTLKGSAELWLRSGEDAGILRQKVTSKGGTTQAALEVFENAGFERIFIEAVAAARKRAGELAR